MLLSKAILEKAKQLCDELLLEEKIGQMVQFDRRHLPKLWFQDRSIGSMLHVSGEGKAYCRILAVKSRKAIPFLAGIDAIHGHAFQDEATVFPVQLAQGATFNPSLVEAIGTQTAKEVLATGLDWSFGPQSFDKKERRSYHRNTKTLFRAVPKKKAKVTFDTRWSDYIDRFEECFDVDEENRMIIDVMVDASKNYNLCIMAVGDSFEMNGECADRANLSLTPSQRYAITTFKSKNPSIPLAAVIIGGKPIVDRELYALFNAVLECWNPCMEGGQAIWDLLYGIREPEGRFPISIPRAIGQIPVCYDQLPGWHAKKDLDLPAGPQFPFGFGLTNSRCSLTKVTLSDTRFSIEQLRVQGLRVGATVEKKSYGNHSAVYVLQVYVHDLFASIIQPEKRLIAIQKVSIPSQKEMSIRIDLKEERFPYVNEAYRRVVELGEFAIYVGVSSATLDCMKLTLEITP